MLEFSLLFFVRVKAHHVKDALESFIVDTIVLVSTLMDPRLKVEDLLEVLFVHVANARLVTDSLTLHHLLLAIIQNSQLLLKLN